MLSVEEMFITWLLDRSHPPFRLFVYTITDELPEWHAWYYERMARGDLIALHEGNDKACRCKLKSTQPADIHMAFGDTPWVRRLMARVALRKLQGRA